MRLHDVICMLCICPVDDSPWGLLEQLSHWLRGMAANTNSSGPHQVTAVATISCVADRWEMATDGYR